MAEENDVERTEPASTRRLEQAREQGKVARSQELTTFMMLMAGGGGLWFTGAHLIEQLRALFRHGLQLDLAAAFDVNQMALRFHAEALSALLAVAPLLGVLFIVAFAAPQLLSGWLFSLNALQFDFHRLNPLSGLMRIVSWHGIGELVKALIKATLVSIVSAAVIWHYREPVQQLGLLPIEGGMYTMMRILGISFLTIGATLAVVAAVDVPWQLWRHADGLKMSRDEVRQEAKESEGDPHLKAAIRSQQRALAKGRMMAEVPKADVVVVNPTHYAVALRYEDKGMRAPRVVAKGAGYVAAAIREIGEQHHVPILEAPPLARALYRHTEIGDEIPEQLYTAVAEVLAYVFQLRHYQQYGGTMPKALQTLAVPPEFDPDRTLQ